MSGTAEPLGEAGAGAKLINRQGKDGSVKNRIARMLGIVVITLSVAALAAEKGEKAAAKGEKAEGKGSAPAAMKPPTEIRELNDMVGNWKCDSKMHMPPDMGGEQETKSTMTIKKALDGYWLTGDWKSEKTKKMPSMKGTMIWGYDPVDKRFVEMGVDSTGAMWHGTSTGLQNDKRIWNEEGVMMGKKAKMRTTVTQKGTKEVTVVAEMEAEPGKWVPMGEDHCKK